MESLSLIFGLIILFIIFNVFFKNSEDQPTDFSSLIADEESKDSLLRYLPDKFIVFDLETTGLSPINNEIIELSAIKIDKFTEDGKHDFIQFLVKPKNKIPAKIKKLTGINQKMVNKDGIDLSDAMETFFEFIGDLRLVAYNAPFDIGFIEQAAKECGYELNNSVSCALKMTREAFPNLNSYKLTDVASTCGYSTTGAHRAFQDCQLTARVYFAAVSILRRTHEKVL